MTNLAQIGCGYWGPNLLRNFDALPNAEVKALVETSPERQKFVSSNYPHIHIHTNISSILNDPKIKAVIIATPAKTHFAIAKKCLDAGKHIFVEKPLTTCVSEIDELEKIATSKSLIVMVGHTFIYNDAVRYIKRLIDEEYLGEIRYIHSQRLNLGRIRNDIDALWNFGPHDISIIQYWLNNLPPVSIQKQGMDFMQNGIDDVVFLNLEYPNKVLASVHVSWLDPVKTRKTTIVGSKKMIVYDDVAENKIKIYDKGIDIQATLGENMDYDKPSLVDNFQYRSGDILIPKIDFKEPLKVESAHFLECVETGCSCLTGIKHARNVVRILQAKDD